jgi:hypothetical protein
MARYDEEHSCCFNPTRLSPSVQCAEHVYSDRSHFLFETRARPHQSGEMLNDVGPVNDSLDRCKQNR